MPLTMETLTDDKTEALLAFVKMCAGLKLYGSEMPADASDDALESMNDLVNWARDLVE